MNGELAGMALSSDPYAFDDVEDTINQPSKFSEISLKPPSQSSWQSMHQSMYNGLGYDTITNVRYKSLCIRYYIELKCFINFV